MISFNFIKYFNNLNKKNEKKNNGDWGLGIGPNPQSPIPNPQSPIPMLLLCFSLK